jgi:sugar-specific transcriptional regulator TrmB
MTVHVSPGRKKKYKVLSPKITRAKRAGGMAQAVECLFSRNKALSSNSILPPKTKPKTSGLNR